MELRHLRYFETVADTGGFSRAARLLHVSQSAISEQIRDLEDEVGVPLLVRDHHRVKLTPHGAIFLEEIRRTLQSAAHAVELAQSSMRGELGTVRIGFFVGGTGDYFARLIRAFRARYPGVRVTLVELTPVRQQEELLAGRIDLAFTRAIEAAHRGTVAVEHLYQEPLVLVLPPGHRLARRRYGLEDLPSLPFVMVERRTSLQLFDRVIRFCAEAGFSPRIVATASVSAGVLTLVQAGEGVAILPVNAQHLSPSELVFRKLPGPTPPTVDLVVAWRRGGETALVRAFLELMRSRKKPSFTGR
jgi:DNA-binding transcriptional LysR family regulator